MFRDDEEAVLRCIRKDAERLAFQSQEAKDGYEYGRAVDLFVVMVMTYLGYERESNYDPETILARKEVWHRADD